MKNEMNPPAGEVKPPHSLDDVHPLMREAATSIHRCLLPLKADASIQEAADALEHLLYQENLSPDFPTSEASMLKQSSVLDHIFYKMVSLSMNPDHWMNSDFLKIALRAQSQCNTTVHAMHKRRVDNKKQKNL